MCRKVAEAADGGTIDIWGDGTAMRAYTYVDDMVDGIVALMKSDLENGVNIGRREYVSVDELARLVAGISGKKISLRHVDGPVGVKARNFVTGRISAIGWESKVSLREGLSRTYPWIESQVKASAVSR
jgi:nucleoside-diphosphate-sugar epimerase